MSFLLGLFIGTSIFILGLILGTAYGYGLERENTKVAKKPDAKGTQAKILFDDFSDFIDLAIECKENNSPLQLMVRTENGTQINLILSDKQMHLSKCFNMDNEG